MAELGESRKGTFTYGIIEGLRSKNKPINFDEFVDLVTPRVGDIKTKEGLRTIFGHVDKDGDDIINYEELKQLARLSGDYINDE
jgi:Ca2+-binding EF-hand superfamily protein